MRILNVQALLFEKATPLRDSGRKEGNIEGRNGDAYLLGSQWRRKSQQHQQNKQQRWRESLNEKKIHG